MNVQKLKRVVPRALWPYLGDVRRWLRTIPPRPQRHKQRLLSDASLNAGERELLSKVSGKIFYRDRMYDPDGAHYFRVGLRAIHSIDTALAQANLTDVRTILDLPSGGGRVLRFLSAHFPAAKITACDIQREAVDFCVEHLGAEPVYSSANLNEVSLETKFDLIWCGSLVTHLNEGPLIDLLKFFKQHLNAGSLLVFTTHGDYVAARLPRKEFDYGLDDEQLPALIDGYERNGFGFAPWPKGIYDSTSEFGVSLTSSEWVDGQVRMLGGMRKVYFASRGWDDHQDVFGFVRE